MKGWITMKKIYGLILSLVMVCCVCVTPVQAAEKSDGYVFDETIYYDYESDDCTGTDASQMMRATDYDLGDNGTKNLNIENFIPGTPRRSSFNYSTNSTQIRVKMKSDKTVSVRVSLYNKSSDALLSQYTVTVRQVTPTTVTFSGLTSASKYYIQYENLGQQTVHITGSISA